MNLKHRKYVFLGLLTLVAGCAAALYGELEGDFLSKSIQVVIFQQVLGTGIYLGCFGGSQTRSPFE